MPYRFKIDEPLQKGFRRIMAEQVDRAAKARAGETDAALAVHETRKCIKRMRALVRAFRVTLGDDTFKSLNARLRDIAALLAEVRDTRVMLDTVNRLQEASSVEHAERLEPVKAALVRRLAVPEADEKGSDAARAIPLLQKVSRSVARLKLGEADIDDVARGVESSYRDGRKAFKQAFETQTNENFHEWRKTVQRHWRQMNLVSEGWPDYFGARVALARDLAQTLGDDHDLAMLARFVGSAELPFVKPADAKRLLALFAERQADLRARAQLLGTRLYAEGASGLGRRIAVYWRAATPAPEPAPPPKRKT
jgi:CHAD domain-containing protein